MKDLLAHASITTFLSVIVSLGICFLAFAAVGGTMGGFAIALCVICSVVLAFPASAYHFWQRQKVVEAHEALTKAHSELAAMHRRLAERARRDDMTGLLNRAAFIAAVEEAFGKKGGGSLLLIDVDHFKRLNDTYGHLAGDEALRIITRAVSSVVREADVIGRLGGEEFGVFIAGALHRQAFDVAERVRMAVESSLFLPDGREPVRLTVSIGLAGAGANASFLDLMKAADKQLYEAKRQGRNRVATPGEIAAAA